MSSKTPGKPRALPPWLRIQPPTERQIAVFRKVEGTLIDYGLHTICESGKCPNRGECWSAGTATFLLMGDVCTRACRFCGTATSAHPPALDNGEPEKLASAVNKLGLRYAVLTSVDRDDLPDQGANHIARTIRAVKEKNPGVIVEALIPDFCGNRALLETVVAAQPDVLGHNVEVVEALQAKARDARAGYEQSLRVLSNAKKISPGIVTKSSLMVGLGETREQMERAMDDLRAAEVDVLTIGQYLQPNERCLPVERFVEPAEFKQLEETGRGKGFEVVVAGPFVRSSYKAAETLTQKLLNKKTVNLRRGKSVFKAGKLLRVFAEYDDKIRKIAITGDFFMHPEEGIAGIEKGLVGTPVEEKAVKEKLDSLMTGIQVFGFDAEQLTQAIMAACTHG